MVVDDYGKESPYGYVFCRDCKYWKNRKLEAIREKSHQLIIHRCPTGRVIRWYKADFNKIKLPCSLYEPNQLSIHEEEML